MKQADKIKRQRFEAEMKIIELEERQKHHKLTKNEEKELEFLKKKTTEFDKKLETLK